MNIGDKLVALKKLRDIQASKGNLGMVQSEK